MAGYVYSGARRPADEPAWAEPTPRMLKDRENSRRYYERHRDAIRAKRSSPEYNAARRARYAQKKAEERSTPL